MPAALVRCKDYVPVHTAMHAEHVSCFVQQAVLVSQLLLSTDMHAHRLLGVLSSTCTQDNSNTACCLHRGTGQDVVIHTAAMC